MTELALEPPVVSMARDRHFSTDHLHADLKGRSVRGGAVTLSSQALKFVLQMGSTAVLARLLTPADFGLIAMVSVVTGFISLFRDMGLSVATVQRAEITHEQVSVLFWINVAVSLALSVVCMALAPAIAWFYHEPRLVWVTVALAATFIFGGLAAQHAALLQRQMRFGILAASDLTAMACGFVVAICLALRGASYWALVAMVATQSVVGLIGVWLAMRWWPGLPRRGTGVMPMLRFGGNLTGFNFLNYFTRNFDNILIGAFLGAEPLGIYSKAYGLLLMPISQINGPVGAVALPALSRLQHQPARYREYFLRAIEIIGFCGMPMVAFAFVDAKDLVLTLLGPQWIGAVPIFRCLAPAAFMGTLNVAPGWLCGSLDRTYRQFRWAAVAAPVSIAAFVFGLHWGTVGVAAAFSMTWGILLIAFIAYSCAGSPVSIRDIALRLKWPAVVSIVSALTTSIALPLLDSFEYPLLRVALAGTVFIVTFLSLCSAHVGGRHAMRNMLFMLNELRQRVTT